MAKTKSNEAETKSNSSLFSIHVRPDLQSQTAKMGHVKGDQFIGETQNVIVNLPEQLIENGYEAYVVRDKEWAKNGKFEWAKSISDDGAEKIEIRFLENSKSLDAMYQDKIGLKPGTDIETLGWMYPSNYRVDFVRKITNPTFIEFMEHHELNGSNPLRLTNNTPAFVVVDAAQNVKKRQNSVSAELALLQFKNEILADEDREYCLSLIHGISMDFDADDRKDMLLQKIDAMTHEKFVLVEEEYLKNVIKSVSRFNQKKLLTFDEDGYLIAGNDKKFFKGFPIEEIEEKGKQILSNRRLIDDFEEMKKGLS